MAGHSKWANIQHRKNAQDAKRGKIFTKIIREVTVAAKIGGSDLSMNSRLRVAVEKAQQANMPKDILQRAIKRGSGADGGEDYSEVRYEGYAPGGVAIMVDCTTDNRNRTVGDVRHLLTKLGGNLGTDGSVSYLFKNKGQFIFSNEHSLEKLTDLALELNADDINQHEDGSIEMLCAPDQFESIHSDLKSAGFNPDFSEVTYLAETMIDITDAETAEKIVKLVDALEDLDDVQHVYTNADLPEIVL